MCLTLIKQMLSAVPVHPWSKESIDRIKQPGVAGRDFARLVVALKLQADLVAFDCFGHSSAFDGRDVDESVSAAVVG